MTEERDQPARSPGAERKRREVQRRREAGEHYLQKWIPKACLPAIEKAIAEILQNHNATQEKDATQ